MKIPAIKRVKIDNLKNCDENLHSLFKKSCPTTLDLFCSINACDYEPVQLDYYIDDLKQWLKVTSDEIYLHNFKICSNDLNTIMKSSSQ